MNDVFLYNSKAGEVYTVFYDKGKETAEKNAQVLAKIYPNTIYFFADDEVIKNEPKLPWREMPWGELPYDNKAPLQVIDDYVLVRGDLREEYAREQLAMWIERYAESQIRIALALSLTELMELVRRLNGDPEQA